MPELVEIERELSVLLLRWQALRDIQAKHPKPMGRYEAHRELRRVEKRIGELHDVMKNAPAKSIEDVGVKLRRLEALLDDDPATLTRRLLATALAGIETLLCSSADGF